MNNPCGLHRVLLMPVLIMHVREINCFWSLNSFGWTPMIRSLCNFLAGRNSQLRETAITLHSTMALYLQFQPVAARSHLRSFLVLCLQLDLPVLPAIALHPLRLSAPLLNLVLSCNPLP